MRTGYILCVKFISEYSTDDTTHRWLGQANAQCGHRILIMEFFSLGALKTGTAEHYLNK
jgi:hypothetical protein